MEITSAHKCFVFRRVLTIWKKLFKVKATDYTIFTVVIRNGAITAWLAS